MLRTYVMWFLVAMAVTLPAAAGMAETPLDPNDYVIINGLGSDLGCDYDGSGMSYGQIGVSHRMDISNNIYLMGAVEIFYDDGRLSGNAPACQGNYQVYTMRDRLGVEWGGLTNTAIAVKFPELCSQGSCNFSTHHICASVSGNGTIDEDDIEFPCYNDEYIAYVGQPDFPIDGRLKSEWVINTGKTTHNGDEQVRLIQTIQSYTGKPYFDLTWTLRSNSDAYSYNNVKFYYAADTFTSGVDFGYGYTCDICPIAGASGGSVFFQGLIGLNKSFKQAEHSWGHIFYTMAEDTIPHYTTNPLNGSADDPAPLSELIDNGLIQQWGCDPNDPTDSDDGCTNDDTMTVSSTPTYISARWTFEDPIRMSTYGTAQSLLELNYDDKSTLFDVHFDPTDWRGFINAYSNPIPCQKDQECTGTGETCLKQPGCIDADIPCPRFCAKQICSDDAECLGRFCLFGFCVDRKWEIEEDLTKGAGNSSRDIMVMNSDGSFSSFESGNASEFAGTMGVTNAEAAQIIDWARGELMSGSEIIPSNDDHTVDLMRTDLLRNRDDYVMGDITHARPVFVGQGPLNPGFLDSQDKIAGKRGYAEYVNSAAYMEKTPILLVASNDGMLHCLDADTGEELWAIVPEGVLPRLADLAKPYYEKLRLPMLDLTPFATDVFKYDSSDALLGRWATVVILGMRGGGNEYYAIDITNPKSPVPLWVFTDPDLGQTYARPTVARVELDSGSGLETQVVVFGSGYADSQALQMGKQGYIYAVSLFDPPTSGSPQLLAKINVDSTAYGNVVTGGVVIDEDRDGYDEKAYVGDLAGHLWRLYFVGNSGSLTIENSLLYSTGGTLTQTVYNERLGAGGAQEYSYEKYMRPISGVPTAAFAEPDNGTDFMGNSDNTNKVIVMFGSGKFDSFYDSFDKFAENPEAAVGSQTYYYQDIYGVVDRSTMADRTTPTVAEDTLQLNTLRTFDGDGIEGRFRTIDAPASPTCADDSDGCKGWRIELQSEDYNRGERIVTDPQFVGGVLFLTTFTPNGQGTCDVRGVEGAGGGYLMAINYQNGSNPNDATLDKNLNGIVNEDDNVGGDYVAGMRFTGGILSSPVVDAVSGAVYFKTGTDVMPTKVNISPMGSFRGATTILYRVKY